MATDSSIERSKPASDSIEHKLANFLLNPPINLYRLSIWTLVICLVLFFTAGIFNQMLLAMIFSAIAGVSIFVAITQTKFFWQMNRYLEAHLHTKTNKWVTVALVTIGVTALIASFFIS